MAQLHFYVPDDVEKQIRQKAKIAKLPLSKYLAQVVKRETQTNNGWPEGYFELFGTLFEGEDFEEPPELVLEERLAFD